MSDGTPDPQPSTGRATNWIAVISSIVTIVLTIGNGYTKARIDAADESLKEREASFDDKLKSREADLEDSKDRINRYTFVRGLIPDVIGKDAGYRSLTVNLIRLSLTDDEAGELFNGLALSKTPELQSLGSEGVQQVHQVNSQVASAAGSEQVAFQQLASGQIDKAIEAFTAADRAYPGYHYAQEISEILKQQPNLADPAAKRRVLRRILQQYSAGIPADTKAKLRQQAGEK